MSPDGVDCVAGVGNPVWCGGLSGPAVGVAAGDASALEGVTNRGVGDVEALADAGEGFTLLVAGDGVVDLGVGESALFADVGTAGAENFEDAPFAEVPGSSELVDAGAGMVVADDGGAVGVGESAVQCVGFGPAGVVLRPVSVVIVVGSVDGPDDDFGPVDQHRLVRMLTR